jgi:dolichyl-phosphate-mannose--protein O-mannosyl transferase
MTEVERAYAQARIRKGAGWLAFASAMLVVGGALKIIDGFWAFKYDDDIKEQEQTVVFNRDPATWGWIWLALGTLLVLAGFTAVRGAQWARWFGIVAAGLAAIVNYSWIVVQPFSALVFVFLMFAVIYALIVYGGPDGLEGNG